MRMLQSSTSAMTESVNEWKTYILYYKTALYVFTVDKKIQPATRPVPPVPPPFPAAQLPVPHKVSHINTQLYFTKP